MGRLWASWLVSIIPKGIWDTLFVIFLITVPEFALPLDLNWRDYRGWLLPCSFVPRGSAIFFLLFLASFLLFFAFFLPSSLFFYRLPSRIFQLPFLSYLSSLVSQSFLVTSNRTFFCCQFCGCYFFCCLGTLRLFSPIAFQKKILNRV